MDYKAIGKAETFDEDIKYIFAINRLDFLYNKTVPRRHSIPHDKDRAKKYFSALSANQRRRLYEVYKLDFEMFGYDTLGYM